MAEIEYCKGVQNSCSNSFCGTLNNELAALKYSVTACLYNILNSKLEARTKISVEDSRLIYPNHCKYYICFNLAIFNCIILIK